MVITQWWLASLGPGAGDGRLGHRFVRERCARRLFLGSYAAVPSSPRNSRIAIENLFCPSPESAPPYAAREAKR